MRAFRILLSILLLTGAAVAAGAQVTPISVARTLPAGTVVTVEGSVTVPSGDFASSTFDQGFALQDETGGAPALPGQERELTRLRKQPAISGARGAPALCASAGPGRGATGSRSRSASFQAGERRAGCRTAGLRRAQSAVENRP